MDPRWIDPELDDIFKGEPELAELAHRIRGARPEAPRDPRFSAVLRAQLMREAESALRAAPTRGRAARAAAAAGMAGAGSRTPLTPRRSWWRRPARLAWGGASFGLALTVAAALVLFNTHVHDNQPLVTAQSTVAELHAVSPNNVITVAFNEPMNRTAVVAGLHIRPATQVSTAWQGNNLLITPTHRLAGNTPYTVTIDRAAAKSANGAVATSDIQIAFGTAPTPPPGTTEAHLSTTAVGPVDEGAQLIAGPSGGLIATSSNAAGGTGTTSPSPSASPPAVSLSPNPSASASASSSPSSSSSPSATPSVRQSPSPSASPSPSDAAVLPAGGNRLVLFGGNGTVDLGPAASSAALSADGGHLISAVASGSSSQIVLTSVSNGRTTVLTTIEVPVLATGWLSSDTALVAEVDRIVSVDLQGHVGTVASMPGGVTIVVLAPGGHAFAGGKDADGMLLDLTGHQSRPLVGSRTVAAFSGDGTTVAWIDSRGATPRLVTSPVDREAPAAAPLDRPASSVAALALDRTGTRAALIIHPVSGNDELEVATLPSGTVIARGPGGAHPVFTTAGNRVAYVAGGQAQTVTLSGGSSSTASNALPDGAAGVLQAFTQAQTAGDAGAMSALAASSVNPAAATPRGLTRADVISAAVNPDGSVAAAVRLIVDASSTHPLVSFADEALTLIPSNGRTAYQLSAITVSPLHDEPVGPHVVHVTPSSTPGGALVLQVAFDSDLRPETVAPAISVTTKGGRTLKATVSYDADRRSATVTLSVPSDTPVSLTVATGLLDVDSQALAAAFTTLVGG